MKFALATLLGFLLCLVAVRISVPTVKAQQEGMVHVYITAETLWNLKDRPSLNIPGGRVVGISCLPKPTSKAPDQAVCYVATSFE